jgi:cobalt-zinc-cadmium efflux system outer membrane protein
MNVKDKHYAAVRLAASFASAVGTVWSRSRSSRLNCVVASLSVGLFASLALCQAPQPPSLPMNLVQAVSFALQNNPELAAIRQQRGIAEAAVVIARTYPYNPVFENRVQANNGPISAGITNRVALEQLLLFEVEVRGQGTYRRQGALAGLSRTEWEIAGQEQALAVRVIRAFHDVLYRRGKLKLIQDTLDLNRQILQQLTAMNQRKSDRVPQADLIVASTEIDDVQAQLGTGRTLQTTAEYELRRALGLITDPLDLQGTLEAPVRVYDADELQQRALDRRPDFQARQMAVAEAEAKLNLAIADRHGNMIVGPAYTYDPTRVNEIGAQLNIPIPIFNKHRGEIQQRQEERALAILQVRQTEVAIRQDVRAALDRLARARATADAYSEQTLPNLQKAFTQMQSLFDANKADFVRLIDVRRKLLKARDSHLDALLEVRQALADLAAAIGEPGPALR